ncbi:MAG: hypothetical protein M0Z59_07425 [Nitrospiraceae bacterium]|nr:hypothetical protein [Nitrospiraceae bacterium]
MRPKHICKAQTKAGKPCRAEVLPGKELCFAHDPEAQARQAEERKSHQEGCGLSREDRDTMLGYTVLPDYVIEKLTDKLAHKLTASFFQKIAEMMKAGR